MIMLLPDRIRVTGRQVRRESWPRILAVFVAVFFIAVLLAARPETASADIPISQDDFEDHGEGETGYGWLDDWEFGEGSSYSDSDNPHGGSSHIRLRGRSASAVRSALVAGESSLRLRFWGRSRDLEDNEAVIEVSEDGSNFVELRRWNSDDDDEYTFFDFDLSSIGLSFTDRVWLRARVTGEEEEDGDLFIDDVVLVNTADDPGSAPDPEIAPITLDGEFDDWSGKANITDVFGDGPSFTHRDISALYWANNIDEGFNFHMIERHTKDGEPLNASNGQKSIARYVLYVDTNNDGDYTDSGDRRAVIFYLPRNNSSFVNVKVYPANSTSKIYDSGWNDWGDSRQEGGLRVEFALDWDDLGISFGGVIRMYAVSFNGVFIFPFDVDRVPDGNADVQWSPASVLGPWLLGAAGGLGALFIWYLSRRRRLWT